MNDVIVMKFGGTSIANRERVSNAVEIIKAQSSPKAVVVSAAGGVTNLLLEATELSVANDIREAGLLVAEIRERHLEIAAGISDEANFGLATSAVDQIHSRLGALLDSVAEAGYANPQERDEIAATGEKAMSILMAAALRSAGTAATHLFADTVIATDSRYGNAKPDRDRTRRQAAMHVLPLLAEGETVVMTGFIGGAPDGTLTTLGRGGSDYSATLLGAAIDAEEVQIWTDVPGVLSADPHLIASARVVPQISFDEAQELAHFGAKVLHPRTIRPAVAREIPVRILSTFTPLRQGTLVTKEWSGDRLKAVTAMRNLQLITIDVPELEDLSGAASVVFGAMYKERIEVVLVSQASSRRRMTYLIDSGSAGGCKAVTSLLEAALVDYEAEVGCKEHIAVIAAVGRGAAERSRALAKLMGVLGTAEIPVLAASQQMSNAALVVAIPEERVNDAVVSIHEAFIDSVRMSRQSRRKRKSRMLAESVQVG